MKKNLLPSLFCALLLVFFILSRYYTNNEISSIIPNNSKSTPPVAMTIAPTILPTSSPKTSEEIVEAVKQGVDNSNEALSHSELNKETLKELLAGTIVDVSRNKEALVGMAFYYEKIDKDLKIRIQGKSYKDDCTVPYDDLRYVRVLYYGFDGNTHIGELIVNKQIAKDVTIIFKELYQSDYPIEQMVLIDNYNADDEASMEANNTTAFNYRTITGSSNNLSKHALGMAIDINPLYNPYVKIKGNKIIVSPDKGYEYQNRTLSNPYYIVKKDICYNAFIKRGFTWGGSWSSIKDYQHFEKTLTTTK